jgi:probable HAF family extracellular repeat protein
VRGIRPHALNLGEEEPMRGSLFFNRARWPALVCATLLALAACGGGGDDAASETAARPQPMVLGRTSSPAGTPLTSIPEYTVTNLSLGDDIGFVTRKGINASGQVAGAASVAGDSHAFFFDGNAMLDLGTFGGSNSHASALNDGGQVTGAASLAGTESAVHAFSWTAGGGLRNISSGFSSSSGVAINSAGLIVGLDSGGGFSWNASSGYRRLGADFRPEDVNASGQIVGSLFDAAERATSGVIRQLDGVFTSVMTSALPWGTALMINDSGLVGGYALLSSEGPARALAWAGGNAQLFGSALSSGGDSSAPTDLNQAGQMVGYAVHRDTFSGNWLNQTGFVRSPGTLIADIGNLAAGEPVPITFPLAINNHDQVVGYSGSESGQQRAFTWTLGTGIVDLNTKLSNPPPGLFLYSAVAISDNGSIVAQGTTGLVLLKPVVGGASPTAPALGAISVNDPVAVGSRVDASVAFSDVNTSDTHSARWEWDDTSAATEGSVAESNGAGRASGTHVFDAAGVYKVKVTITDSSGRATQVGRNVVVYDRSAGFVTGSGWFNSPVGAYKADETLAGRATFGFVSRYAKGATVPIGETQFRFHAARLSFRSESYDWLVVDGARAQYKGSGRLNGRAGYKFKLTAVDGALLAKARRDRFRVKIWHFDTARNADVIDYDNLIHAGQAGGNSEGTAIDGGRIVIHK